MSYFITGWKLDGLIYSGLVVAIITNARAVVLLIAVRIVVVNKCIVKSVSNLSKSYFLTIVHLLGSQQHKVVRRDKVIEGIIHAAFIPE